MVESTGSQAGGAAGSGPGEDLSGGGPEGPESGDEEAVARRRPPGVARRPVFNDVRDRVIRYVIRGLFFLVAAGIGLYTWRVFFSAQAQDQEGSRLAFCIVGACVIALVMIVGEIFLSRSPVRIVAAMSFGLLMGLALSMLFQPVIDLISLSNAFDERQEELLQLVTTVVLCYYAVSVLLQTRDDFKFIIPYVEFRKDVKSYVPLIVDTSMIIDGRVGALLGTGILDQRLIVPRFVLDELQSIADSGDRSRRERGRRGMDELQEIRRLYSVEILERAVPRGSEVDQELIGVAADLGGKLLTTDFNLQKRARLQGVAVINVNDIATALKPVVVPGERLRVKLLREGDASGQAVGFLTDGTMVVVENANRKVGQSVDIEVTSSTQTSAGKMIFGRLKRSGGQRRGRQGRQNSRGRERESRDQRERLAGGGESSRQQSISSGIEP